MLQTTQDIFYLVLSICVAAFTVFICIALFYTIRFFKQTTDTLNAIKEKFERIAGVFHFLRNKIVSEGLKTIVGYIKEKKSKNQKNKKSKIVKDSDGGDE